MYNILILYDNDKLFFYGLCSLIIQHMAALGHTIFLDFHCIDAVFLLVGFESGVFGSGFDDLLQHIFVHSRT